ncbi:A-macroglobulin complement component [Rubripirellula tenax]|uniref:A-macroglobulin complement component n=1 Tax=Rubripirellula tenax TaxID=2528015 RepID=A0A5C6F0G8_9BACT|nr:MG2 domain-containing protein [Rubripirellula tenax]TWU54535.1 A-macroglobulin complement component [Rubripirellula tenax]
MNPTDHNTNELRQSLLELHYDLLDEPEAAKLRSAIQTDAEVAAMWAETLALAETMATAAKLPADDRTTATPISLPPIMAVEVKPRVEPAREQQARRPVWIVPTVVAATAACLGFLVIGWRQFDRFPKAPASVVRIEAEVMPRKTTDKGNEFRFVTSRMDAASLRSGRFSVTPAILSFSVLAKSQVLFRGSTETDSSGTGKIVLPSELVIPHDANLEVTAKATSGSLRSSSLRVPLEPTRCLTYLTVDRPVYRPGETIYFRSLTLERTSLRPLVEVPIRYELIDPSGSVVPGLFSEGVSDRGVGNGAFAIPSTAPGGPYTLVAKSLDGFFPEERRDFDIRAYRVPRFKTKIEFRHRSYGPGDTVEADFAAERAEGGPLTNAKLRISAKVDDTIAHVQSATMTDSCTFAIAFHLPTHIKKGAGQLSVVLDDGGTQETTTETIPIQLGRVAVEFYPEGGYLVSGVPNRVYFTARDTLGKPIQLVGEVQSRSGEFVSSLATTRDGMGRFEFTPQFGERYALKVTSPVDVTDAPMLPTVVKDLPVIDTGFGVYEADSPIEMTIRSSLDRNVIVRSVCRGKRVGEQSVSLRSGDNPLTMEVTNDAGGVIRVTVLDAATLPAKPLVERLVYRRQKTHLTVEFEDPEAALDRSPGEPMRMNLQVRNEAGEPTPAVLGIAVVDEAALSLDKVERPMITTHFLLTSEVKQPEDLEHANFYLSDGPEAAESLDLLLGTQGWRRFVSGSTNQPNVDFREQLVRLLELDGSAGGGDQQTIGNESTAAYEWGEYHEAMTSAWQTIVLQTRLLLAGVVVLWGVSLVIRMRRQRVSGFVASMLVVATSLVVGGCGGSESNRVIPASEIAGFEQAMDQASARKAKAFRADPSGQPAPAENGIAERIDLVLRGFGPQSEAFAELRKARFGQPGSDDSQPTHALSPEQLNQLLVSRGLDAQSLADQLLDELRFPVRQYAHVHSTSPSDVREDFAETLYWQPLLITDSSGRASIRFDLSDSVTTFRVAVDAHSDSGSIGSFAGKIATRLPFQIEPQLPLEVTTGDRIDMPIAFANSSNGQLNIDYSIATDGSLVVQGDANRKLELDAGQRTRETVSLEVRPSAGNIAENTAASITIRGISESLSDSIRRTLRVVPSGYPGSQSVAGRLSGKATAKLNMPVDIVDGSLAVTVRAYPSPVADVMSGIESILREPHGCFEQASATNYPNAMALRYLQESQSANPEVAERALAMLNRGYTKLTSYECEKRGYEWFGSDPGHEALSAFGLMQFTDMSKVMTVDEAMIDRTRGWLLSRRDGNGSFARNPRHLHVWSVQQEIVNAYVLWALTEADVAAGQPSRAASELQKELDQLHKVADASRDPYLVALSAATLMNVRRTDLGEPLLSRLVELQNADGSLQGHSTVVSSGGLSRTMETTALAIIAWAKSANYTPQAQAAANWITTHRVGAGGFGSTQATVLALKALLSIAGKTPSQATEGKLQVRLAGTLLAEAKLPVGDGVAVEMTGLGEKIASQMSDLKNVELELIAIDANNVSYCVEAMYHSQTPVSSDDCPLDLTTKFSADLAADGTVPVGSTMQVIAEIKNTIKVGQGMAVAIIGLPGGVEPRTEKLDELKTKGEFDYYELRGRDVVLYWRTIPPSFNKSISLDVTATIPGKYTGPASRAYLYYTAEEKRWTEPLTIAIRRASND